MKIYSCHIKSQTGITLIEMLVLIAYAAIASALLKIFVHKYSFMEIFAAAVLVVFIGLFSAVQLASLANGLIRLARFVSGKSRNEQKAGDGMQAETDPAGRE